MPNVDPQDDQPDNPSNRTDDDSDDTDRVTPERSKRQQPTVPTPVPGVAPEVFDRLADAVDEVLALDWDAESCADKTAGLVALSTQMARCGVADGAGVRSLEADPGWAAEGFRTVGSKLACESNQSRATARRRRRDARQYAELPVLEEAVAAGEVNADAARLILRADTSDLHDQLLRDEKLLVSHARDLEYDRFAQAMRYWIELADTDAADERAAEREANRAVHASRTYDGRIRLDGWLDPVAGAEWAAELHRLEQRLFEADWADARAVHGERANRTHLARTADQRRADALHEMGRRSAAHTGDRPAPAAKPVLNLHMDYETFLAELARHTADTGRDANTDRDDTDSETGSVRDDADSHAGRGNGTEDGIDPLADRLCELDDRTIITPSQALNAALGGEVRRIVFGADGHVLDYGRTRRLFTKALAAAIGARDRQCTQPGCHLPAARCQTDHITEWHQNGPTNETNGETLCRFHNNWKHLNPLQWRRQRSRHYRRFATRQLPPRE